MQEIDDTYIEKVQKKERYDQETTSTRPLVIFHFTVRVAGASFKLLHRGILRRVSHLGGYILDYQNTRTLPV